MKIVQARHRSGAQPAVVLASLAGGGELDTVQQVLTEAVGVPVVRIAATDPASREVTLDPYEGVLVVNGCRFTPTVTWIRHASECAIVSHAGPPYASSPLAAARWSSFLGQLATSASVALPGSVPPATAQAADARRLGIRVPRTLITTRVQEAVEVLTAARVIVKSPDFRVFVPDRSGWPELAPTLLDRESQPAWGAVTRYPVVVQEHVANAQELRVYYLNGSVCAFEVDKPDPGSVWTHPDRVTVTRADCPPDVIDLVAAMCARWGLRYGAFDLLIDNREPVFLEVNADGDWLWYEHKAGWRGVSFMAAAMTHELYVRNTIGGHGG